MIEGKTFLETPLYAELSYPIALGWQSCSFLEFRLSGEWRRDSSSDAFS